MAKANFFLKSVILTGFLLFLSFVFTSDTPSQSVTEPKLNHSACVYNCMMDLNFYHSKMGDTAAANSYYAFMQRFWETSSCSGVDWENVRDHVVSVIADVTGTPTGATLDCYQLLLAETKGCANDCLDYYIPNLLYGPNVRVSPLAQSPGYLEVAIDNHAAGLLPEETPNGYSGHFYLTTTLQLNDGKKLVVGSSYLPDMSFPNWITRGGSLECNISNVGSDCPSCCEHLSALSTPDYIPTTVEFMDGVLYDLTDYVSNKSGVEGSFSQNGFVELKSNDDKLTINQGPFRGIVWTHVHNRTTGRQYDLVQPWDATYQDVKIKNSECNWNIPLVCSPVINADTYVFALEGPPEKMLPGDYTVQTVANVLHDKDFSNNRTSYTYSDLDVDDWVEPPENDEDSNEPEIDISTLPIIDIPGEGIFNYTLPDDGPGMMFRLVVPQDVNSGSISVIPQSGMKASAYGNWESIPVPDYPQAFSYDYRCSIYNDSDYIEHCQLFPGTFYLFVESRWTSSRSFSIDVQFITNDAATATASYRQTRQADYALTQQALIRTFTEVESNDSQETANEWDMVEPFTGESPRGDEDYIAVTFNTSGIYTFGITEVSPETKVFLGLLFGPGGFLDTASSLNKGEGVSLTMDASAGERFYFKVTADRFDEEKDETYYGLELLDFIPDPFEPNDEQDDATFWDISQGPIEGYFFDKSHVSLERADYYKFTAPATANGSPVTLQVTNPSLDISICVSLRNQNGSSIFNPPCSEVGEAASLVYTLVPGQTYYIKLSTGTYITALLPYSLSASYIGDDNGTGLSEVEPNDSMDTANPWDMKDPFTGVLSTSSDRDYIQIDIPTPGIYTFSVTDVSPNLKVELYLVGITGGGKIHQAKALAKGEGVQLTMDGSAGEQYFLVLHALEWGSDGSFYQLALTGFIPDPGESNDKKDEATFWEIDEGPIQGYFWERTHWTFNRADYVKFTAPLTQDNSVVTFYVDNPGSDISVCMNLLNYNGSNLLSGQCSSVGEDASLTSALTAGMDYYIKLSTVDNKPSAQPYTLSIDYTPGEADDLDETSRLIRLHGFVYRQWGLLPLPMANVPIYVHISGQPAFLLDTTNWLGTYSAKVMLADGQVVTIWPDLTGTNFEPENDVFTIEAGLRHHRSVFTVIGGQFDQDEPAQTPTPTGTIDIPFINPSATRTPNPEEGIDEASVTPSPIRTTPPTGTQDSPSSSPTETKTPSSPEETAHSRNTEMPTKTRTLTLTPSPTRTPTNTSQPPSDNLTTMIGMVWRLFERSGPAGVAGAEVILSINGVDQPAVFSQIDGLYLMDVEGIQPGDVLRLRAQASQDSFEPIYYEWKAEQGVNRWEFDFYSYWDEITPPASLDQNFIWGTVWDQYSEDVSGLYLNLQVGTSDAFQRIGPTDENGYFEAYVTIPNRMMVTVWVDAPGFLPSKLMFFHPYEPENRELIFWRDHGENIQ